MTITGPRILVLRCDVRAHHRTPGVHGTALGKETRSVVISSIKESMSSFLYKATANTIHQMLTFPFVQFSLWLFNVTYDTAQISKGEGKDFITKVDNVPFPGFDNLFSPFLPRFLLSPWLMSKLKVTS